MLRIEDEVLQDDNETSKVNNEKYLLIKNQMQEVMDKMISLKIETEK